MVSGAGEVAEPSSVVSAGSTGRYRSIEMGPKTVSRLRTTASARPTRCWTGAAGAAAVEVVTDTRERGSAGAWQGRLIRVPTEPPLPSSGGRSVDRVDNRIEVREFLTTRRAKLSPDQAGVPLYGQRRRVP